MASGSIVHLSPIQSPTDPAAESPGGEGEADSGGPELTTDEMVLWEHAPLGPKAVGTTGSAGPSESSTGSPVPSLSTRAQTLGLAPDRSSLSAMGLPQSVVQTLQGAWAPSTRAAFLYHWVLFESWCRANQVDALTCAAQEILQYLQGLLEAGKSQSTFSNQGRSCRQ